VRWFWWGSGHEEWHGSVCGVRRSSLGGCSGAGRAGVSCPRRPVARRRGGKAAAAFRELGVCVECKVEGNGSSTTNWCCWAEEGGKKSRRGRGTRWQRGGGRQELGWPWHSRKRTVGEGSRTREGGGRRVERPGARGGAGDGRCSAHG
jgi:hypothetical protein